MPSKVKQGRSVSCSSSQVWHHLKYSSPTKQEFRKYEKDKTLSWNCEKCILSITGVNGIKLSLKIKILIHATTVTHGFIKNALGFLKDFLHFTKYDEPCFCWDCNSSKIALILLEPKKIQSLLGIKTKKQIKNKKETVTVCSIWNKKITI